MNRFITFLSYGSDFLDFKCAVVCPYYYKRRRQFKEAIHMKLHPNNINSDSGIEIPEARMPTIKKHNNRRAVWQRTAEGANPWVNSKDRNAPIRAVEKQLITAEHHALWDHAWPVNFIAWRRLTLYFKVLKVENEIKVMGGTLWVVDVKDPNGVNRKP